MPYGNLLGSFGDAWQGDVRTPISAFVHVGMVTIRHAHMLAVSSMANRSSWEGLS